MSTFRSARQATGAIALLTASVSSAFGGILLTLNDGGYNAEYVVHSTDPRAVSATFTRSLDNPGASGIQGKLFIEKNFTDNSPLEIVFEETGFVRNFGLRIQVSEKITNSTDKHWRGFRWALMELNNAAENSFGDDGTHPAAAHFHAQNDFNHEPFTQQVNDPMGRPYAYTMTVRQPGLVPKMNGMFTPGSTTPFVIHEWSTTNMGADGRRMFKLVQTPIPVPEPGTYATFIMGAFVLFAFRRRSAVSRASGNTVGSNVCLLR